MLSGQTIQMTGYDMEYALIIEFLSRFTPEEILKIRDFSRFVIPLVKSRSGDRIKQKKDILTMILFLSRFTREEVATARRLSSRFGYDGEGIRKFCRGAKRNATSIHMSRIRGKFKINFLPRQKNAKTIYCGSPDEFEQWMFYHRKELA